MDRKEAQMNREPKDLEGELITEIDVIDNENQNNQVLITTASGRQFLIHHSQDWCEYVRIEGIDGEFRHLVGKVIEQASEVVEDCSEGYESATRTTHTFKADKNTVVVRWFGESNGFYSESVDITEITLSQS